MKKLSHSDYLNYYARKCEICHGARMVSCNGVRTCCSCQHTADVKFRFEQIQIYPEELKYKTWSDFTGEIRSKNKETGQSEITGTLSVSDFIAAKKKAMEYCFGYSNSKVLKDKRKHLIVHKQVSNGKNIIIAGAKNTGKTLLATLILKEVVNASCYFNLNMDFRWIKASDLANKARWFNDKPVDHDYLDSLQYVDFLVIDGLDIKKGGHTNPPDIVSLDVLFQQRSLRSHTTVVVCTSSYLHNFLQTQYIDKDTFWGDEFQSLMTHPKNLIIELKR